MQTIHILEEQLEVIGPGHVYLGLEENCYQGDDRKMTCLLGHLEAVPGKHLDQDQQDVHVVGDVQLAEASHHAEDVLADVLSEVVGKPGLVHLHHRSYLDAPTGGDGLVTVTQSPSGGNNDDNQDDDDEDDDIVDDDGNELPEYLL